MINNEFDIDNIEKRMKGAIETVKDDFQSLRTPEKVLVQSLPRPDQTHEMNLFQSCRSRVD